MCEGFVMVKDDDLYVGSDNVEDLFRKWKQVLFRFQENGLTVSAKKDSHLPCQSCHSWLDMASRYR